MGESDRANKKQNKQNTQKKKKKRKKRKKKTKHKAGQLSHMNEFSEFIDEKTDVTLNTLCKRLNSYCQCEPNTKSYVRKYAIKLAKEE